MNDARRVAEAIAAEGVGRVLLYGSVARGQAGPRSDIDLVAIHADLDYTARWERKNHLERVACEACGWPVEVNVTDEPEWRVRTTAVRSSFEAGIAAYAIQLAANDAAAVEAVDWDKPIGRPASDAADIAVRLELAGNRLISLRINESPSLAELERDRDGAQDAAAMRRHRHTRALGEAYQVIVAAARVMHAATLRASPPKGDDLAELLAPQPPQVRDAFNDAIDSSGAALDDMHYWRDHGTWRPDQAARRVDPTGVLAAADAAYAVFGWVLDHLDLDQETLDEHRSWIASRPERPERAAAAPPAPNGPQTPR